VTKAPEHVVLDSVAADAPGGVTLATAISDRIRSEILSGKKKPGTKLRLDEIKAEFGVSWSPIREGLSRLLAEGLVTTEDQRGFRVAPVLHLGRLALYSIVPFLCALTVRS